MTTIYLNQESIEKRSLIKLIQYMEWNETYAEYLLGKAGTEHYKLLADISLQLKPGAKIADIGSFYGTSALALSINESIDVTTYDIESHIQTPSENIKTPLSRTNLKQKLMRGQDDIEYISMCDFILLDVDPHDGKQEKEILDLLIEHKFRGILCCDDIKMSRDMKEFWNNIPENLKKIDVSHLGHWTGTGIVVFDPSYIDIEISPKTIEINIISNEENNQDIREEEIKNILQQLAPILNEKYNFNFEELSIISAQNSNALPLVPTESNNIIHIIPSTSTNSN